MDGDRDSSIDDLVPADHPLRIENKRLQAELTKANAELATLRTEHAQLAKGFAETSAAWRRLVKTLG